MLSANVIPAKMKSESVFNVRSSFKLSIHKDKVYFPCTDKLLKLALQFFCPRNNFSHPERLLSDLLTYGEIKR